MPMNLSTQSYQELVMQELAELSETQREEVLSFIHSVKRKKSLIPQDSLAVPSTYSVQIQQARDDDSLTLIALKQFPAEKQHRLNFLTEKNAEGIITKEELSELEELVGEAQALMLQNTETLARTILPDLFNEKGEPIKSLITQAVRAKAGRKSMHKGSTS